MTNTLSLIHQQGKDSTAKKLVDICQLKAKGGLVLLSCSLTELGDEGPALTAFILPSEARLWAKRLLKVADEAERKG